jgi:2-dehydropantoate 2-reductase
MDASIAVLGAGALGAPVAGHLASKGRDVVIIDPWVDHVQAVNARGLRITTGPWDDPESRVVVEVRALHVFEAASVRPRFDVVFLTSKAYDSAWLAEFITPYLADDGYVVCMQNSLTEEWVEPIVGTGRVIGCVLTAGGGELVAPGDTWRDHTHNAFLLGELDGKMSARLDALAEIVSHAAVVELSTNIRAAKWTKLAQTAMAASWSGITGRRTRDILGDDTGARFAHELGLEVFAVAEALGQELEPMTEDMDLIRARHAPETILPAHGSAKSPGKEAHNFIYQDILKGRKTEIDFINGLLCRKGADVGVPTPVNDQAVDLVHRVERGELTSCMENLELLTF